MMMFQSSPMLGLVVMALCLLNQQEVYGYGQLLCPPGANVGDPCYDGDVGTCKEWNNPNARKRCVPADCGAHPDVMNGTYEEYDCWQVYTCAWLVCDDDNSAFSGDPWIQCWFDGWNNGWGVSGGANCTAWF